MEYDKLIAQVEGLRGMKDDWDGEGTPAPNETAIANALRFLRDPSICPHRAGMPTGGHGTQVFPMMDPAGVIVEWGAAELGTACGHVEFHNDGSFELWVWDRGSSAWPVPRDVFEWYPKHLIDVKDRRMRALALLPHVEHLDRVAIERCHRYTLAWQKCPYSIGLPHDARIDGRMSGGIEIRWADEHSEGEIDFLTGGEMNFWLYETHPIWLHTFTERLAEARHLGLVTQGPSAE